jgi:hypothetical protein
VGFEISLLSFVGWESFLSFVFVVGYMAIDWVAWVYVAFQFVLVALVIVGMAYAVFSWRAGRAKMALIRLGVVVVTFVAAFLVWRTLFPPIL